jgi:hypothetical protein
MVAGADLEGDVPGLFHGTVAVATAWSFLGLRLEETASKCGGWLRIYRISSRRKPTRGGPPAWILRGGLKTPYRGKKKKKISHEILQNFFSLGRIH